MKISVQGLIGIDNYLIEKENIDKMPDLDRTNKLATISHIRKEKLSSLTLEELFDEARTLGRVNLFSCEDGTFTVGLTFNSIEHTRLEAHSGYKHSTIKSALISCINNAYKVKDHLTK